MRFTFPRFITSAERERLARFDQCVADTWSGGPRDGDPMDPNRPAYPLKRFFQERAKSVRAQLAGEEAGVKLPGLGGS